MHRNYLLGSTLVFNANAGGAASAMNNDNGQNNNSNNNNNNNNQGGNNNNNNNQGGDNNQNADKNKAPANPLDAFKDSWKPKAPAGGGGDNSGGGNNNNNNNNNSNNNNSNQPPGNPLQDFLNKQNYFDGVDQDKFKESFEKQDFPTFKAGINTMMQNIHRLAMRAAKEISEQTKTDVLNEARSDFSKNYNKDQAHRTLFDKYPGLKHDAMAPLARTFMNKQLDLGKSPEDAAKMTNDYFVALGSYAKPNGNPGDRQRGNDTGNGGDPGGSDMDFDSLFTNT